MEQLQYEWRVQWGAISITFQNAECRRWVGGIVPLTPALSQLLNIWWKSLIDCVKRI